MATKAPKKKWQFFGQTISDLSTTSSDSRSNSPRSSYYETPPSGESTRHSSPFQMLSLHSPTPSLDYPTSAPPIYAPTPIHPQDYSHQALAAVNGPYPSGLPEPPHPPYARATYTAARFVSPEPHSREGGLIEGANGEVAASSSCYGSFEDDGSGEALRGLQGQGGCLTLSKNGSGGGSRMVAAAGGSAGNGRCQKRPQRCRMCANHGMQVDMKGHKWYCPYRECPCGDCDITRKTQYYMKERQKLTRHQQQQQNEDRGPPESIVGGMQESPGGSSDGSGRRRGSGSVGFDQNQMDFPRVDEMVSQTKNILDYELFEKVNQACRPPRSSTHLPN